MCLPRMEAGDWIASPLFPFKVLAHCQGLEKKNLDYNDLYAEVLASIEDINSAKYFQVHKMAVKYEMR